MKKMLLAVLITLTLVGCNANNVDAQVIISKFNEESIVLSNSKNLQMEVITSYASENEAGEISINIGYEFKESYINTFLMEVNTILEGEPFSLETYYDGTFAYINMMGMQYKEALTPEEFSNTGMTETFDTSTMISSQLGTDTKVTVNADGSYTLTLSSEALDSYSTNFDTFSSLLGTGRSEGVKSVSYTLSKNYKITGGKVDIVILESDQEITVPVTFTIIGYGDNFSITLPDLSGYTEY